MRLLTVALVVSMSASSVFAQSVESSCKQVVAGGTTRLECPGAEPRYPMQRWIPWTVLGAGAVASIGGVLWHRHGRNLMDEYDRKVAQECAVSGCDLSTRPDLTDLRDRAELHRRLGTATIVVGGIGVITGFVLVLVNRPALPAVDVGTTHGGAQATASWRF